MLIRPATCTADDVLAIHAIEEVSFSQPWRPIDFSYFLCRPESILLMAEEDEALLGYVGMQMVLDEGHIQTIATSPEARRRGVATALLDALLAYGKEHALAVYYLEVRASNLAAQALYEKFGFVAVGRRKDYYKLPTEDAILMTRTEEQP